MLRLYRDDYFTRLALNTYGFKVNEKSIHMSPVVTEGFKVVVPTLKNEWKMRTFLKVYIYFIKV